MCLDHVHHLLVEEMNVGNMMAMWQYAILALERMHYTTLLVNQNVLLMRIVRSTKHV